ncbi:MAG: hypothetical protein FWC33_03695 [Candidatus Bathyarchaeota archaeon]|nr:hypothetical protein [Candidatus Termiticorpusculum sp.]
MPEYLKEILQKLLVIQVSDNVELEKYVEDVLENNCKSIENYKTNEFNIFGYGIGQYTKTLKCAGIHNN